MLGSDPRYLSLLGQPGSNPLELFWDVVDQLDQELEAKEAVVVKALEKLGFKVELSTALEEFLDACKGDESAASVGDESLKEVYDSVSIPFNFGADYESGIDISASDDW